MREARPTGKVRFDPWYGRMILQQEWRGREGYRNAHEWRDVSSVEEVPQSEWHERGTFAGLKHVV